MKQIFKIWYYQETAFGPNKIEEYWEDEVDALNRRFDLQEEADDFFIRCLEYQQDINLNTGLEHNQSTVDLYYDYRMKNNARGFNSPFTDHEKTEINIGKVFVNTKEN